MSETESAPCAPEDVAVVVPVLNEAGAIEACLRSLLESDDFARRTQVIVADGGSTDGTQQIVRDLAEHAFPNISLIDNPDRLQSAAVNRAAMDQPAPRKLLIRCDGHSVYPEGYVRRVAEALTARPEAASVATVMDATGNRGFQRAAAWVTDTPIGSGGSAHRGGRRSGWVDHGHHAGFRLDWFRRIGGYDPAFSHNEDAEYDYRLAQAGGRVWLESDIRLQYAMRPTLAALWRQYMNYGMGRARTRQKHEMRLKARQIAPALHVALTAFALLVSPVLPAALLYPAFYIAVLAVTSVVGAAKLRSTAGLWAGPALAAMHFAWGIGFLRQTLRRPPHRTATGAAT
ncbi:glycosyltransferase family 2 protein [Tranquillimonas rosea]|uniref:glycosyltransferase family 2 protein n=1 Tax=Tranquillimonas rosea TaxID=641238 RepID=UPI003BA8672F